MTPRKKLGREKLIDRKALPLFTSLMVSSLSALQKIFQYLSIPKKFGEVSQRFEQPVMDREYFEDLTNLLPFSTPVEVYFGRLET